MSRWVKVSTIGFMAGMSLAAWAGNQSMVIALLAIVASIIGLSLFPRRSYVGYAVCFILTLMAGMFLFSRSFNQWQSIPETTHFSGPAEIIDRGEAKVFYRPVTIRPKMHDWIGGDILFRAPVDLALTPGTQINFSCPLARPKNFEAGFDYRNLLASRGIGYACERGGTWETMPDDGLPVRSLIANVRVYLFETIQRLLPEPEAGLLKGLLIGGSESLSPETKSAFARAGLSHIVAVSGYNMSVVAEGFVLLALIIGLWRRWAVGIAVLGLVFFLLLIDGSAASLRAALMAWLAFGAYFVGRPAASFNGLLLAASLMLLFNPLLIRYDVGFQLSFLATLALLFFARHFETFDFFRSWYGKVAALFLTTFIIELFTLPIIIANFGMFSFAAPIANVLVLPLVPIAMFIGIAAIILTSLLPILATIILPILWLPLALIIRLTEWFGRSDWAALDGLDMDAGFALGWYLGLGAASFFLERLRKKYVLGLAD